MTQPLSNDMKAAIVKRYAQGFSCREVGAQFGVSLQTVANIIEDHAPHLKREPHYGMRLSPAKRLQFAKLSNE